MVFECESYNIYGAMPIGDIVDFVQLNKYGNITIKTSGLELKRGHIYTLGIIATDSRYGTTYVVKESGFDFKDINEITPKLNYELLCELTSEKLAKNIQSVYPNFVKMVLLNQIDNIDLSRIHGVGKKLLSKYITKINNQCSTYLLRANFPSYNLNTTECNTLIRRFDNLEYTKVELASTPYKCLIDICDRTFFSVDNILGRNNELKQSPQRIEYLIDAFIRNAEYEGSTYIDAVELANEVNNYDSSVVNRLKDVAEESEIIVYNNKLNILQRKSTYLQELDIAKFIKRKVNTLDKKDWDWAKFTKIKDGELTDEQSQILKTICESSISCLVGYSGTGKAQPIDTVIPTPIGDRRLGDLQIGDYVFDRHGNPTKVIGIFPQGQKEVFEVTLKDGRKTLCNDEHIFSVWTSKGNLTQKTVREMIERPNGLTQGKGSGTGYRYAIPNNDAIEYEEKKYDIDPYIIGAFIGDGCCLEQAMTISSDDEELVKEIASLMPYGTTYKKQSDKNYNWVFVLPKERQHIASSNGQLRKYYHTREYFSKFIDEMCCKCGNKRIPNEYKYGSISQRLSLLQGLFDADGHISDKDGYRYGVRYSTTSYVLTQDVMYILRSLGYSCTVYLDERPNRNTCYEIRANVPNQEKEKLFRLSRRKNIAIKAKVYNKHHNYNKISITNIKGLGYTTEMVCIMVDNEEHLYLTNDFIVTHNTSTLLGVLQMLEAYNQSYIMLSPTGKAAMRLKEQTGRQAYTIHKATMTNDIHEDWIIIDEMSMVSNDLLSMIIQADSNPNTRYLFVGDSAQLPSIGLGKILGDIIKSKVVPVVFLTKCFRFDEGGASYVSTLSRKGQPYLKDDNDVVLGVKEDYVFTKWDGTIEHILKTYTNLIEANVDKKNICVLSPQNVGTFGTLAINNLIQSYINPIDTQDKKFTTTINNTKISFHKGDLVIITKNNYQTPLVDDFGDSDNENTTATFNGQIGEVLFVDTNNNGLVVNIEGEKVFLDRDILPTLRLAYCISVHKAQGSSFPYIIELVIPQHKHMLTRELLYTAQTRLEKKLIEIGTTEAVTYALNTKAQDNKSTRLYEFLTNSN